MNGPAFETLFLGVRPLIRRCLEVELAPFGWLLVVRTGDLERVRARFSRLESEPDPSFSSDIGAGDLCLCCLAAERVMGAKYESCLSETSEGVGEGEMTRGVDGMG